MFTIDWNQCSGWEGVGLGFLRPPYSGEYCFLGPARPWRQSTAGEEGLACGPSPASCRTWATRSTSLGTTSCGSTEAGGGTSAMEARITERVWPLEELVV